MARLPGLGLIALGLVAVATAQTSDTSTAGATGGTPGSWVQAALKRHNTVQNERLNRARFGGDPNEGTSTSGTGTTGTSTSNGGLGGLGDLSGLLSLAGLGGSSSLGSLLSGLTGSSATGTSTTGSTTGTIPPPSNGTSYTLADLIALGQQYGGTQKTNNAQTNNTASTSTNVLQNDQTIPSGGALGRLSKYDRNQANNTTTEELDFKTRWANAMLQTFFSALTVGLQSQTVIEAIKDGLRPLITPTTEPADTGDSSDTGDTGDSGDTGDTGDTGSLPPAGGNNGGSEL